MGSWRMQNIDHSSYIHPAIKMVTIRTRNTQMSKTFLMSKGLKASTAPMAVTASTALTPSTVPTRRAVVVASKPPSVPEHVAEADGAEGAGATEAPKATQVPGGNGAIRVAAGTIGSAIRTIAVPGCRQKIDRGLTRQSTAYTAEELLQQGRLRQQGRWLQRGRLLQ